MSKAPFTLMLSLALLAPAAANAKRASKAATRTVAAPPAEAAPVEEAPTVAAPTPPPVVTAAPPSDDQPNELTKRIGIGYKVGNGLGFVGGDIIVNVVDHVAVDLQANWISLDAGDGEKATGWGVAGEVQLFLKKGQVSSPFVGVGLAYASLAIGDVSGSATGAFANLGYEFRWQSGFGILLGLGGGYVGTVHVESPTRTLDAPGGASVNIEGGLRYMFL